MTETPLIKVTDVSKRFVMHKEKSLKERILNFSASRKHRDDFWALRNIDLDISAGTTVGLVGHNGSGKSTLLKVIGGIIEPTTGTVSRRGRMAALLELGAGFHPDLTGRENVYLNAAILGLSRKQTDQYFDAIVDFSGIEDFIDTQVKFYSSGMYVRLAFAVAVHVDPDLLLVDEVLAVGDEPFQRKCMDKIEEFQRDGRTIVLVSHSADQVGRLCDRVVVLNRGELIHDGNVADGLRVLRRGFEQERIEHDETHHVVAPPKTAFIDSIVALPRVDGEVDVSREPKDKSESILLEPGSDIVVRYRYRLTAPQAPIAAGIAIETVTGLGVYGLNTTMLKTTIPAEPGFHEVDFVIDRNALGAGQYSVRGSLEEVSGASLDRLTPASTFEIAPYEVGSGLVRLDASAVVVDRESASTGASVS
jgi:ABC-2 type transport system ATP-binding protein